jgi:diguanylate cyclase (GGDEF)-like protein/PAS domain S-box-containing protein
LNTHWIVFASILIINAVIAVVIAARLAQRPKALGRNSVIAMLTMLAVWSFTYAMITLVPSLEAKKFWLRVENIGILSVPAFWLLFTLQYSRPNKQPHRLVGFLFFIIPLITLVLVWSDNWFGLYYSSIRPVAPDGGPLIIERGVWYPYATIHAYLLNLAGMFILIRRAIEFRNIYRRQAYALIGAVLIPIFTNIFYQAAASLGLPSTMRVDLTPISFTLSATLIAFGIFSLHIFDLIPIARHTVMEHIPEMVFVVNAEHKVIDVNNVGLKWLKKSAEQVIGQNPMEVFKDWSELVNRFAKAHDAQQVFQMPGDSPRTLEMVVTPLYDSFNNLQGRVIVAHDISDHIRLEDALRFQLAENEALRLKLQEQAIRDPLTNVYNRRFLAESLDREIPRAKREERPVSIVILDVDHFKDFNDTYGHKCGDEVLQFLANLLVSNTRREDIICRYGGEEFIILMANTSLETAYERAEALRQMTEQSRVEYEGMDLGITFSAGVASFPIHGQDGESVLQAADKALYRSKNDGRNRVTTFNK